MENIRLSTSDRQGCMEQADLMVDILGSIIEFRNGESALHVIKIRKMTELLLHQLCRRTDRYSLNEMDIRRISLASAIHDIGKIAISNQILDKHGRLTEEEQSIVRDHAMIGAGMVRDLPIDQEDPLVRTAYEICRWHHERYDGSGYPDGLKGDDIPISAQAVGVADVYSTMTADRIYKKALDHDVVIKMMLEGQCGVFHPDLMACLHDVNSQGPVIL